MCFIRNEKSCGMNLSILPLHGFLNFGLTLFHSQICGKRCGTAPSEDNDTLFLGNVCNTWTKEAVSSWHPMLHYLFIHA